MKNTKPPQTASQSTCTKCQSFTNLSNIKTVDSNYAQSHIGGKLGLLNRPSTITVNKFQAGIPTGGLVSKITVQYKHARAKYNNSDCNVQAPTISLMNGNTVLKDSQGKKLSKKGQAPTLTAKECSVTFTAKNYKTSTINSNDFGVKIDYPTNANNNEGYVRLYYVRIIIEYKTTQYGLSIQKINGQYNHDVYEMEITISNKNRTTYVPIVSVEAPDGFAVRTPTQSQVTVMSPRSIQWRPQFQNKSGSKTLKLSFDTDITYATGVENYNATFTVSENLNGTSKSKTYVVKKTRPVDPTIDTDTTPKHGDSTDNPTLEVIPLVKGDWTSYTFIIDDDTWDIIIDTIYNYGIDHTWWARTKEEMYDTIVDKFYVIFSGDASINNANPFSKNEYITWKEGNVSSDGWRFSKLSAFESNNKEVELLLKGSTVGYDEVYVFFASNTYTTFPVTMINTWKFDIMPTEEELQTPFLSLLPITGEELDRLGDGYSYTAQTFLKEITTEEYVRKWYKNFRIGVFNNAIEANVTVDENDVVHDSTDYTSLTVDDIFDNAAYWGEQVSTVNNYENLTVEFPYNENYPLYIIIVGDYNEATDIAEIKYTEPCIIESEVFENQEMNGTYPVPIDDLVLNDGSSSEMTIPSLSNASTLVFYDLPLDEDYGTNDEIAIRGLEIRGTVESNTDNLILYGTLKNSKNETRQRSITLDELDANSDEREFSLGGVGDLWGFSTLDITNLEDWEAQLTVNNALNDSTGDINFGNIQFVIYLEQVEEQNIKCYIDGEDLSYYGVFLTNRTIPEGLKTDTDYINVNGTDVNDPYNQNIREKQIELEFEIGDNCDLEASTLSLREVTRLIVNKRDEYNKPIAKRIEFSDYPDVFWEYIVEDTLDNEIEISSYSVKAKLTVPAGTAYDKEQTKANDVGFISGLASIRPIIQIKPSGQIVHISEENSEQEFTINGHTDWVGSVLEIDCENRQLLLKEDDDDTDGENVTSAVDFNSDWFTLQGEFKFTTVNCVILAVIYQERW